MKYEKFPGFKGLNQTQIDNFVSACKQVSFPPDLRLIEQGTRGDSMYFIIEGELRVFAKEHGAEREFMIVSAPAVIGEMELLTGAPRAASVHTITKVETLEIPFDAIRSRIKDGDPGTLKIFFNVAQVLAHRLAAMDKKLMELAAASPKITRELSGLHQKLFSEWNF